jgi:hypothetical protein
VAALPSSRTSTPSGALLFFALCGLHPTGVLLGSPMDRERRVRTMGGRANEALAALALACVAEYPPDRPSLKQVKHGLERSLLSAPGKSLRRSMHDRFRRPTRHIRAGLRGLLEDTVRDRTTGLWMSAMADDFHDGDSSGPFSRAPRRLPQGCRNRLRS